MEIDSKTWTGDAPGLWARFVAWVQRVRPKCPGCQGYGIQIVRHEDLPGADLVRHCIACGGTGSFTDYRARKNGQ